MSAFSEETEERDLVRAFLRYAHGQPDSETWAFIAVDEIIARGGEPAWQLLIALLAAANSQEEIGFVAAGPLENLVKGGSQPLLDRMLATAREWQPMREALSMVWTENSQTSRAIEDL